MRMHAVLLVAILSGAVGCGRESGDAARPKTVMDEALKAENDRKKAERLDQILAIEERTFTEFDEAENNSVEAAYFQLQKGGKYLFVMKLKEQDVRSWSGYYTRLNSDSLADVSLPEIGNATFLSNASSTTSGSSTTAHQAPQQATQKGLCIHLTMRSKETGKSALLICEQP